MMFLRNAWRRTAFCQFFEALDPVDRATFWVAAALALAGGICFSAIVHS
jgi:hypothetical protein